MKNTTIPVVILLDILFVFLFIMMLKQDRTIEVNIPANELFKGAKVIRVDSSRNYYIYRNESESWERYIADFDFAYYKNCNLQCWNFPQYAGELRIYFPDDLLIEMSKTSFVAFDPQVNCQIVKFDVTMDGKIDKEKLLNKNPCLKKIPNFRNNIKEH